VPCRHFHRKSNKSQGVSPKKRRTNSSLSNTITLGTNHDPYTVGRKPCGLGYDFPDFLCYAGKMNPETGILGVFVPVTNPEKLNEYGIIRQKNWEIFLNKTIHALWA